MIRLPWTGFALIATASLLGAASEPWPQFRGPRGDGTSLATNLPLHWSEQEHVAWKTPIHGRAWSSPVVWGEQVWMTTATPEGDQLFAVCVDASTGRVVHDLKLFEVDAPQFAHPFNTYGSPTPVIEEGRVYITFGSPGTACLDTHTGKVLWERRDFVCNHFRGAGSSPVLYQGLFLLNFDGSDHQFVVALDKQTGRTVWRRERSIDYKDLDAHGKPEADGDYRKGFGTCHVAVLDGRPTLLSQGSRALYGYDPLTGDEFWRVEERTSHSASTRPLAGLGLVFFPSGWSSGQVLALRPGKKGEVLDANTDAPSATQLQIVWKTKRNVPKKPSLLLLGDLLYGIDDNGVATCWDALTGKVIWNERVGGNYSASLLGAGDRIYCFSEEGKATVLAAGREFRKLGENQLTDGFMASPAVLDRALILRTKTALYRIQD